MMKIYIGLKHFMVKPLKKTIHNEKKLFLYKGCPILQYTEIYVVLAKIREE